MLCELGRNQSPIDVRKSIYSAGLHGVQFNFNNSVVKLSNDGAVPRYLPSNGNVIGYSGEKFELIAFMIHTPSEHKVNGVMFDLELQLFALAPSGKRLNIAVMANEGGANKALKALIGAIPVRPGDQQILAGIDLRPLVPRLKTYYIYNGSQTTPPCEEGVQWLIMKRALQVSRASLGQMSKIFGENRRSVQPVYGRVVFNN